MSGSDKKRKDNEDSFEISLGSIKGRWPIIILAFILLFGFYLRVYHLDYPVMGYHNWKETHYLTEARNFAREGFFSQGFFVPSFDYPPLDSDPSGAHSDTFPTISIFAALMFKIFGVHLWAARILGVMFNSASIIFMYLIVKELFSREDLAMTSAFVMSITPLLVFFSHNVQLINPGLFFMLVSAYLYILWAKQGTKHNTHRNLIYSSLFFASAVLTKYTFAVIAIPFAFAIPFSRIKETFISMKYNWKPFAISGALLSTIMIWFVYSNYFISLKTSGASAVSSKLINLSALLSSQWWVILKSYTADNYTLIGFWMALLGIVVFLFISRNKLNFENRFILAYAVAALCFIFIMSDKLQGHSYHQYPIAPIVIFFISYLIIVVGSTSERLTNIPYLKFVVIIIAAIFLLLPSLESKDRQFDTQFFGLDIAGDYIQEHSQPDERVMYSNGQTYGLLWHADRKGYGSITDSSTLKKLEDDLNFRWIFIYAWDFPILNNPDTGVYISENYNLKQVGIVNQIPVYFLFEKGGKFNISQINEQLKDKQPQIKKYELNKGTIDLIYFNI